MLKVVDETPEFPHGETAENPMPAPNASRIRVSAAAAIAPAATAAQETAESSTPFPVSVVTIAISAARKSVMVARSRFVRHITIDVTEWQL